MLKKCCLWLKKDRKQELAQVILIYCVRESVQKSEYLNKNV